MPPGRDGDLVYPVNSFMPCSHLLSKAKLYNILVINGHTEAVKLSLVTIAKPLRKKRGADFAIQSVLMAGFVCREFSNCKQKLPKPNVLSSHKRRVHGDHPLH